LVWYFGQERDQFLSLFSEYGVAFLFLPLIHQDVCGQEIGFG